MRDEYITYSRIFLFLPWPNVITHNIFAIAYVLPTYDLGSDDNVTYTMNVNPGDTSHYAFDYAAYEGDADFWTVYLIGAYQGWTRDDRDGDGGGYLGQVNAINGQGASVFAEVMDGEVTPTAYVFNAATTAHELGHLFGGTHDPTGGYDGGIMDQSHSRTSLSLTDVTIRKIRMIDHP